MPSSFFENLGKSVAAELARPSGRYGNDPATRARLSNTLKTELDMHLTRRPMARDQLPPMLRGARDQDPTMPPRGASREEQYGDQGGGPISGADCIQFVRLCLAKLAGPEREEFLMGLADLLSTEQGAQDGIVAANKGALDRRPNGARDRRPGMDSAIRALNTKNFLQRFPYANVKFGGMGR
jgi:hypothetical protein